MIFEWIGYGLVLVFGTLAVLEVERNLMSWWRGRAKAKRTDLATLANVLGIYGVMLGVMALGPNIKSGWVLILIGLGGFGWVAWAVGRATEETKRKHKEDCEAAYNRGYWSGTDAERGSEREE
jgi:hypothetical protein